MPIEASPQLDTDTDFRSDTEDESIFPTESETADKGVITEQPGDDRLLGGRSDDDDDEETDSKVIKTQPGSKKKSKRGRGELSVLLDHRELFIKQQIELFEALSGYETNNKYKICAKGNKKLFDAVEQTGCCSRQCYGAARNYEVRVFGRSGKEVMRLEKKSRCCACLACCRCSRHLCCCCRDKVIVEAPPGKQIGYVQQKYSCCTCVDMKLAVVDTTNDGGDGEYTVTAPCCCQCNSSCCTHHYPIHLRGEEVGEIKKEFSGCCRELFTDADNFGIKFPPNADVNERILLIAATLVIDFMFYENNQDKEVGRK